MKGHLFFFWRVYFLSWFFSVFLFLFAFLFFFHGKTKKEMEQGEESQDTAYRFVDGQLSIVGQDLEEIPHDVATKFGPQVQRLDLSWNSISFVVFFFFWKTFLFLGGGRNNFLNNLFHTEPFKTWTNFQILKNSFLIIMS